MDLLHLVTPNFLLSYSTRHAEFTTYCTSVILFYSEHKILFSRPQYVILFSFLPPVQAATEGGGGSMEIEEEATRGALAEVSGGEGGVGQARAEEGASGGLRGGETSAEARGQKRALSEGFRGTGGSETSIYVVEDPRGHV